MLQKVSAVFLLFLGVAFAQECPNLPNSKKCDNDAHEDSDCRYVHEFAALNPKYNIGVRIFQGAAYSGDGPATPPAGSA